MYFREQLLSPSTSLVGNRLKNGAAAGVQQCFAATDRLAQRTPALGPQIIAGEFQTMLQVSDVLLVEGQGVAQDRRRILHGIALGQPCPCRCGKSEQSGCDQSDQKGLKTLIGQGEPQF